MFSTQINNFHIRLTRESLVRIEGELVAAPTPISGCSQKNLELRVRKVRAWLFGCFHHLAVRMYTLSSIFDPRCVVSCRVYLTLFFAFQYALHLYCTSFITTELNFLHSNDLHCKLSLIFVLEPIP